jgi:hypothetical protein
MSIKLDAIAKIKDNKKRKIDKLKVKYYNYNKIEYFTKKY